MLLYIVLYIINMDSTTESWILGGAFFVIILVIFIIILVSIFEGKK